MSAATTTVPATPIAVPEMTIRNLARPTDPPGAIWVSSAFVLLSPSSGSR